MGIGISGISKARLLYCSRDDHCPCMQENEYGELVNSDSIYTVEVTGGGKDVVPMGCYVAGPGGRTCGLDFNYAAYNGWIRRLSLMALGVEPEEVRNHLRRYLALPFVELIRFADTDGGAIGPLTSAELYGDFVAFAARARRYYATATPNVFGASPEQPSSAAGQSLSKRKGRAAVADVIRAPTGAELRWDEGEDLAWMWESYRQFRRAFRLAKNDGLVVFY